MPWCRFDDRYPSNRKVRPLSDAAFRLDVSAICWSSENLTDGKILTDELPLVSDVRKPVAAVKELVSRGRWVVAVDGWLIHDYLVYNPTKEKVLADRAAAVERQRAARARKDTTGTPAEVPVKSQRDSMETNAGSSRPPSRPVPVVDLVVTSAVDLRPVPPTFTADDELRRHLTQTAAAVLGRRPEWPKAAIDAALQGALDRAISPRHAAAALLAVAADPASRVPARVLEDGYWWQQLDATSAVTIPDLLAAFFKTSTRKAGVA